MAPAGRHTRRTRPTATPTYPYRATASQWPTTRRAASYSCSADTASAARPRQPIETPHEAGLVMKIPMVVLAVGCVGIAFGAAWLPDWIVPIASRLGGLEPERISAVVQTPALVLAIVSICGLALVILFVADCARPSRIIVRTNRRRGGHLGLRLCAAHGADSIHRLVVRPAGHDVVPLAARCSTPVAAAGGFLSDKSVADDRDSRPHPRGIVSSRFPENELGHRETPLDATRPRAALRPLHRRDIDRAAGLEIPLT